MIRACVLISQMIYAITYLAACTAQPDIDEFRVTPVFGATHPFIQLSGRYVMTADAHARIWQPGQFLKLKFKGPDCSVILQDEIKWGSNHNYVHIVLDGVEKRIQLKTKSDTIQIGTNLSSFEHELILYKATEANIGYIDFVSIKCNSLIELLPFEGPKIEFIGNSITCGAGSDPSVIPCGTAQWHDQHNAYYTYPSLISRTLGADSHLSCVSGIGLMRSCCNMDVIMPQVYGAANMRETSPQWDHSKFTPDLISICLGQNDGIQDEATFVSNYVAFLASLQAIYPDSKFVLLSSPMADNALREFQRKALNQISVQSGTQIQSVLPVHIFEKSYVGGCDYHPNLAEHQAIAAEITPIFKSILK